MGFGCSSEKPICNIHQLESNYYCNDDAIPVCSDCPAIGGHKNHNIVKIEQKEKELSEKMEKSLNQIDQDFQILNSIEPIIANQDKKIEEAIEKIETSINDGFSCIRETLLKKKNQLLIETEKRKNELKSKNLSNNNLVYDLKTVLNVNSTSLKMFKKELKKFFKDSKKNALIFSDVEDCSSEIKDLSKNSKALLEKDIVTPFLLISPLENEINNFQLTHPPELHDFENKVNSITSITLNQVRKKMDDIQEKDSYRKSKFDAKRRSRPEEGTVNPGSIANQSKKFASNYPNI